MAYVDKHGPAGKSLHKKHWKWQMVPVDIAEQRPEEKWSK